MKKLSAVVGAALLCGFVSVSFADTRIGVVDVNKVLQNATQIKTMQASLKQQFEPRGKEVLNLQNALRDDVEKYKKNNTSLKGQSLKKAQQNIIDEQKKLEDTRLAFQRDLVNAQNQALQPILKQVEMIVSKIAQEQRYNVVITKISLAYNDPQLEITDQVLSELNKASPTPVIAPTNVAATSATLPATTAATAPTAAAAAKSLMVAPVSTSTTALSAATKSPAVVHPAVVPTKSLAVPAGTVAASTGLKNQ